MNLHLETRDDRLAFAPGETIDGIAGWETAADEKPPRSVEVRLFWHTSGKGGRDVGVVDTVEFHDPAPADAQPFTLRVPDAPYSFSGRLVSLQWSIELVIEPASHAHRLDLVISPTREEIRL